MAIKTGTTGNDILTGTAGWDTLYGLSGNDSLFGGTGQDILSGGDGNDILEGGVGADALNGGAGVDVFKYTSFADVTGDKITDFSTGDTIDFSNIAGAKFIGNAQFTGVVGEIRYYLGYAINFPYNSTNTFLSIDTNGDGEEDISLQLINPLNLVETTVGSRILKIAPNQTINGASGIDTLNGGAGQDTLSGLAGNDALNGGEGDDLLNGGEGNDLLIGGLGSDTLMGGIGADVFRFASADEFSSNKGIGLTLPINDTIADFTAGDQVVFTFLGISYIGDANFSGVPGQYQLIDNTIAFDFDGDKISEASIKLTNLAASHIALVESTVGSNRLIAAPNKTITGTSANDTLIGGAGYDSLRGNAGNDILSGGSANDTLDGGDGNDTLIGGNGKDVLTGGAGNDVFKYNTLDELGFLSLNRFSGGNLSGDTITDFAMGDQINLSDIKGLKFVGIGNDFSGVVNQMRIYDGYNATFLQIDTNGDKDADLSITLPDNLTIEETATGSNIFQTPINKFFRGTAGNDTLIGGNGEDIINGNIGNDTLIGAYGDDVLNGDDGNDTLTGGLGADRLTGGKGNDVFKYNSLAEFGSQYTSSRDFITDFALGDQLNLSAIAGLTFVGAGKDFNGVANQIRIYDGNLEIDTDGDLFGNYSLVLPKLLNIEETAIGSRIFQVAADKSLNGTSGNDTLTSGNGNDTLNGNAGNDTLMGGYGADILNGGDGNDILVGGLGLDTLTGGIGNDVFKYASLAEFDNQFGNSYERITDFSLGDQINLSAIAGLTFVGIGLSFSGIANQVQFNDGILEIDTNGDTYADYALNLSNRSPVEETFVGSRIFQMVANKTLNGTSGNDILTGGNGNDTLNGNAGNDALTGGYGSDTLNGGDGNDTLIGGLGVDRLAGGTGNDVFKYNNLTELQTPYFESYETITDFSVGDQINLNAITGLTFVGIGNDFSGISMQIRIKDGSLQIDTDGNTYANYSLTLSNTSTIEETAVGSRIFQVAANKTLNGTIGNDTLTGGNGNDTLHGNAGNDSLTGGYGTDTLSGGDGNDTLIGGLGVDELTGGAGSDIFKFNGIAEMGDFGNPDTIIDLETVDKIDLSAIDANVYLFGDQAFTFIGNADFTGVAGQLSNYWGNLSGDIDGDFSADFTINLSGSTIPTASNFIL